MEDSYLREDLLEIYKNPINLGKLENATVTVTDTNPMCGDEVNLAILMKGDVLVDAKFWGDACAVSVISSSLVTEELIGKTLAEIKGFNKKDVLDLFGVPLTTSRVKCATLILSALNLAIQEYEKNR